MEKAGGGERPIVGIVGRCAELKGIGLLAVLFVQLRAVVRTRSDRGGLQAARPRQALARGFAQGVRSATLRFRYHIVRSSWKGIQSGQQPNERNGLIELVVLLQVYGIGAFAPANAASGGTPR